LDEDKFRNLIIFLIIGLVLFFVFITVSSSDEEDNPDYVDDNIETGTNQLAGDVSSSSYDVVENDESTEIKLVKISGVYEVPITINNTIKLNFIFDSGAADVLISPDIAIVLSRSGTLTESDRLSDMEYTNASGVVELHERYNLKSISIGNRTIHNVVCGVSNSLEAPLLLGQAALSKFGKFTFDYDREILILH